MNIVIVIVLLVLFAIGCAAFAARMEFSDIRKNAEILANQPDEPYRPPLVKQVESIKANMRLTPEPDIKQLETLEKVYNHLGYSKKGISFSDYVRKVQCGTWGELAGI